MTGTARREEGAPVAATFADPRLIVLGENKMVGHAIHGMIALGGRSRRGSRVTPTPDSTLADAQQTIADLRRELAECRAQQTATAEVLQVINSSPGNLAPVFEAMLGKAIRLCEAAFGSMLLYNGERFDTVAVHGVPAAFADYVKTDRPAHGPGTGPARILAGERVVHIADLAAEEPYKAGDPQRRAFVDLGGARSLVCVPLLRDDAVLGIIAVYRQEVRPFSDNQIALLQNFAAQAVIAFENARLLTTTREALDQQTATAEVLQVINSSPGDLAPVFDAMLEKAVRLCGGSSGILWTLDGQRASLVASTLPSSSPIVETLQRQGEAGEHPLLQRVIRGDHLFQFDLVEHEAYRAGTVDAAGDIVASGVRSVIWVALVKDNTAVGVFVISRRELRAFSGREIALLQNFGAQAVIAMENARLINETREALEQQTATAEVLQVINSSPGDLAPVFEAMLEKALRLCEAAFGHLRTYDGERFHLAASRGAPAALAEFYRKPLAPVPGSPVERLVRGESIVHMPDLVSNEAYRAGPGLTAIVQLGAARSYLSVALRKEETLLGYLAVYRGEVGPFSDKRIALLQNFAAQAVIAMENARLLTETREALEQQTATAEILQVINSSPGDLAPVFEAMLDKALRLCEVDIGVLWIYDGEMVQAAAIRGAPSQFTEFLRQGSHRPARPHHRLLSGERVVQIADITTTDAYRDGDPIPRATADLGGVRTLLSVPLLKDETVLGNFAIYRREVRPFTDKQIALLQNFAAQAVIAMENARLITETREALEQQTATAEVLQVINSSPGDLTPVFDAILEKAMRLCEAAYGVLWTFEGDHYRAVALQDVPSAYADTLREPVRVGPQVQTVLDRISRGEVVAHIVDMAADEEIWRSVEPTVRAGFEVAGFRTVLGVALRKDEALLGAIAAYRKEVRPFTEKQIAILQNFAAQAVIAIENARLLDEIRQRQAELRVTFDNMADGVAMFDEDLRLAAWNRNFQEIADLPEALLAERPSYVDYLRILTERGELDTLSIDAELSRRIEHADQELRLERTRPNGRVIEVRRNAVPDGGFVLIYSDITERKRSEAEIRAARDAAEAAYRDLKATQASLIQAEKMASLGQLTAGIAHEIKNPLNFVNNFADLSVELLDELKETTGPAIAALGDDKRTEIDETIGMLTGNLEKIAERRWHRQEHAGTFARQQQRTSERRSQRLD